MSPWAQKALIWILEIPTCLQQGTAISDSPVSFLGAFNSWGRKLFQHLALQTITTAQVLSAQNQIISERMWDLLSAQFEKTTKFHMLGS